jgi:hypothetical protein
LSKKFPIVKSLFCSLASCPNQYDQAGIKAAKQAKSWKATTRSSFALHHLTTTDEKLAKDQKKVFDGAHLAVVGGVNFWLEAKPRTGGTDPQPPR